MNEYVIDASVCANLFLSQDEELVERIGAIFQDQDNAFLAPEYLKLEFCNVITRQLRNEAEIYAVMAQFNNLEINFVPAFIELILQRAISISLKIHDTVYDSYYHALALTFNHTYLTCDTKYYHRAKKLGGMELLG